MQQLKIWNIEIENWKNIGKLIIDYQQIIFFILINDHGMILYIFIFKLKI